jgi:hypothetical protein
MRRQMVDVPDEGRRLLSLSHTSHAYLFSDPSPAHAALILDPAEVRDDPVDEQMAAPMDDVDPYADHRQFKPYI